MARLFFCTLLSLLYIHQVICVTFIDSALPKLNILLNESSVSGFSSGGAMAVQFHTVYSSILVGAGIFAGVPYDCAAGQMMTALTTCMDALPSAPDAASLSELAEQRAKQSMIDPIDNMARQRVYMFSGTQDHTVYPAVMNTVQTYYSKWIAADQISYINTFDAAHVFPTNNSVNTNACTDSSAPYISNCNYDGAGQALNWIYGDSLYSWSETPTGAVITFDISPYIPNGASASDITMNTESYVYVPPACSIGTVSCRVHIAFHGCAETPADIGTQFVTNTGYINWADNNDFVLLFPQASKDLMKGNPNGCWNWWGFNNDGTTYDTNTGAQLVTVRNILNALAGVNATHTN